MERIKRIISKLLLLLSVYTGGVLLGGIVFSLKVVRLIKIKHNIDPKLLKNGFIVVSNHPSLIDPLLISNLFFRQYMKHPIRYSPWNIAETKNYKKWYWQWAEPRMIWVNRDEPHEARKAFRKAREILNKLKGILVIFAEGGRTSSNPTNDFFYSPEKRRKLRPLERGVGLLIKGTNSLVCCAWIDGSDEVMRNLPGKFYTFPRFWRRITITVGEPFEFEKKESPEVITQKLVTRLLKLADEE